MDRRRIDIFVGYCPPPPGQRNDPRWKPLNAVTWTRAIDRGLKPHNPAKGVPRPVFDPEATSQHPTRD